PPPNPTPFPHDALPISHVSDHTRRSTTSDHHRHADVHDAIEDRSKVNTHSLRTRRTALAPCRCRRVITGTASTHCQSCATNAVIDRKSTRLNSSHQIIS